jgi:hypothetical protein
MIATQCAPHRTNKGLSHTFNRTSGWCDHGCGNRDDGRITNRTGTILNTGPTHTPAELEQYRQQTIAELARKKGPRT